MRRLRSISARVMLAMVVAGALTACVAIFFASRSVVASEEAQLVNGAVGDTGHARDAVAGRLAQADAEARAAAWAFRADHAFDVPAMLSPFVLAVRVRGPGGSLDVARVPSAAAALEGAARGASPGEHRLVGGDAVLTVVEADDVRLEALVDVGSLVRASPGGRAWLSTRASTPSVAQAAVVARRVGDVVETTATVEGGLEVHARTPLAAARAEVADTVRRSVVWSFVAVAFLVLLAWALARGVTRPILALAKAVRSVERGEPIELPALRDDEIGELGAAIRKMRAALARDAELLGATARLARRVAVAGDPAAVLAALSDALRQSHPTHAWHVLSIADVEASDVRADASLVLTSSETGGPRETEVPFVILRASAPGGAERLLIGLVAGAHPHGLAVGTGPIDDADQRHVEVLARTAVAALRSLGLAQASLANEKLAVLGRLSAGVAHEMNNPLASMLMNLEALGEDLRDETQREAVADVRAGAERLAAIVRDLSSVSRAGTSVPRPEPVDTLVRGQARVAVARRPGVTVGVEGEVGLWVACERGRVEQALLNLLVNAIDATSAAAAPTISVRVTRRGPHAAIAVSDDGPGIPLQIRHKLFDAFVTTKGERGTGLGLFLSRSLMQAQGGDLVLESTGPEGTTFAILLPLAEAPDATHVSQLPPSSRRPSVLVIDDEVAIVRAMERLLGKRADVVGTTSPGEGLARAAEREFSLVLCDLHMPGMRGDALVAELRRLGGRSASRVVLMTGSSDPPPAGVRVVRKPLQPSLLAELLDAR